MKQEVKNKEENIGRLRDRNDKLNYEKDNERIISPTTEEKEVKLSARAADFGGSEGDISDLKSNYNLAQRDNIEMRYEVKSLRKQIEQYSEKNDSLVNNHRRLEGDLNRKEAALVKHKEILVELKKHWERIMENQEIDAKQFQTQIWRKDTEMRSLRV